MKNIIALVAAAMLTVASSFAAPILITDFGSTSLPTINYSDFTSNVQTASSMAFVGVEGNMLFGDLTSTVAISSPDWDCVTITGIYTGAFTGSFVVELFDISGNSRSYGGSYASFTPSVSSTVYCAFGVDNGFDGTVTGIGFTAATAGGTQSVNLQATNLSATSVPEPATWLLLAGGLTAVMALRRRRQG
ncbi:MAG: PEP-CTERM sorting domain-containing protein [Verrucomicrobiae bacterium]